PLSTDAPTDISHPSDCVVLTGGRDGQMHRFEISVGVTTSESAAVRSGSLTNAGSGNDCAVAVRRVGTSRLTDGWVAQLVRRDGRLFAVSFYNKRLVVTDVTAGNTVLLSVVCSGGAKQWQVLFAESGIRVAFIHHGQLWTYKLDRPSGNGGFPLVQGAVSSVDIRTVGCASTVSGALIVATGGEDGCLRIHHGPPSLDVVA
ncbi:hypothetical protein LPJ61_005893, partial [Coemansia biformis]